jgi:nucleotide-binding universal stress UspA family protein
VGRTARDRRLITVTDSPGAKARSAEPAVIVWLAEGTWHATIDAARHLAPPGAGIVLLHVTPQEVPGAARGAYAGLLGRGHPERDPGRRVEELATASAAELLDAAARRLARPCTRTQRRGRPEREVTAAAEGADLLIVARDGDRTRAGPKSLGPASRFVVDHAPCPVLLVWPGPAPAAGGLPPAPPHPPQHRPGRG